MFEKFSSVSIWSAKRARKIFKFSNRFRKYWKLWRVCVSECVYILFSSLVRYNFPVFSSSFICIVFVGVCVCEKTSVTVFGGPSPLRIHRVESALSRMSSSKISFTFEINHVLVFVSFRFISVCDCSLFSLAHTRTHRTKKVNMRRISLLVASICFSNDCELSSYLPLQIVCLFAHLFPLTFRTSVSSLLSRQFFPHSSSISSLLLIRFVVFFVRLFEKLRLFCTFRWFFSRYFSPLLRVQPSCSMFTLRVYGRYPNSWSESGASR